MFLNTTKFYKPTLMQPKASPDLVSLFCSLHKGLKEQKDTYLPRQILKSLLTPPARGDNSLCISEHRKSKLVVRLPRNAKCLDVSGYMELHNNSFLTLPVEIFLHVDLQTKCSKRFSWRTKGISTYLFLPNKLKNSGRLLAFIRPSLN